VRPGAAGYPRPLTSVDEIGCARRNGARPRVFPPAQLGHGRQWTRSIRRGTRYAVVAATETDRHRERGRREDGPHRIGPREAAGPTGDHRGPCGPQGPRSRLTSEDPIPVTQSRVVHATPPKQQLDGRERPRSHDHGDRSRVPEQRHPRSANVDPASLDGASAAEPGPVSPPPAYPATVWPRVINHRGGYGRRVAPTSQLLAFAMTEFVIILGNQAERALHGQPGDRCSLGSAGVATVGGQQGRAFTQVLEGGGRDAGPLIERSIVGVHRLKLAGAVPGVPRRPGDQATGIDWRGPRSNGRATEEKKLARIVGRRVRSVVTNPKVIVFLSHMAAVREPAGRRTATEIMCSRARSSRGVGAGQRPGLGLAGRATVRAWRVPLPRRLALLAGTGGLAMIAIGTRVALHGPQTTRDWAG